MSKTYKFGLAGVSDDVQFGKEKVRLKASPSGFRILDENDALVNIAVRDAAGPNDAVSKQQMEAAIDAVEVPGALSYKGAFDASAGNYDALADASQGDYYKVSVAGNIGNYDWAVGDNLIVNKDVTGVPTEADIDKIDNTESPDILRTGDISTDTNFDNDPSKLAYRETIRQFVYDRTESVRVVNIDAQDTDVNIGAAIPAGCFVDVVNIVVQEEFDAPYATIVIKKNGNVVIDEDMSLLSQKGIYEVSLCELEDTDAQFSATLDAQNSNSGNIWLAVQFHRS